MKRLALIGTLLLVAGCQHSQSSDNLSEGHSQSSDYLRAVQLLDAESNELQKAYFWSEYVKTAFLPDGFYPFEGENLRGVAPKTKEEAAEEVQKASEYLAKQRLRVERARQAREAAER
jgi:hypothetical protein